MTRYWYAYLPRHVAGSSGNTLLDKFLASDDDVRLAFSHCATIDYTLGTIHFYKRP